MSNDKKTLADVRNLIVCDTQFGWTGSTSLKMQEMLALQERGWVAEGAENLEFDLTEAGREVVSRALQSAVQPTLADVQPGGRVRLGDGLAIESRARELLAHEYAMSGSTKRADKIIAGFDCAPATEYAVRAIVAALSAQPSPGGQGDWRLLADVDERIATAKELGYEDDIGVGIGLLQCVRAALAARQPVADQHPDDLAVDAFAAAMKAKMAAARAKGRGGWEDPAQCTADDLSRMLRDHVEKGDPRDVANFCMMLHQRGENIGARQPVGQEPVALGETDPIPCAWSDDDASSLVTLRDALRRIIAGTTTKDAAHFLKQPGQRRMTIKDAQEIAAAHLSYVESLVHRSQGYAAPPGQAVDLGPTFQAGVAEWMGQCFLPSLYSNMTERGDRLLEEVLELLQAHGYDSTRVPTLVDYVFGRPVGEPAQEVGGVMVTLAGYCWVAGLDMHAAGAAELARISQPEVMAKIRAKQEAKNALQFDTPLPGNSGPNAQAVDLSGVREAVRKAWQKCAAGESVDLQFGTLLALIDSQAVGK